MLMMMINHHAEIELSNLCGCVMSFLHKACLTLSD